MSKVNKMAHLFHWPSRPEYQKTLLRTIALPIGARGQLYYGHRWVNKSFANEINDIVGKCGECSALFWALSCKQNKDGDKVVTDFDFACPVRFIDIMKIEDNNDHIYIDYIARDFLASFESVKGLDSLKEYVKIDFGGSAIPHPGVERGYVQIGPEIADVGTTQTPSLELLYCALKGIPSSLTSQQTISIDAYPLVLIKALEGNKVGQDGSYGLSVDREYKISLSYYQGEAYRDRRIYICGNEFVGKSIVSKIPMEGVKKSKDMINIEVKFDDSSFIIPLVVVPKIPWYRRRLVSLLILAVISAVFTILFIRLFPNSDFEIKTALVFALLVMLFEKLWEVLTKKN